jgi:hypothetical protein
MANNIKPEISLGVKGPQAMSLSDLVGTATKAMEFQRLSELYPELIKKTQTEVAAGELGLAERRLTGITSSMTALINNPLVVQAEENPGSVDPQKLLSFVTQNGMNQAKALGIPDDRAKVLLAPYLELATKNPGALRQFAKERLIAGLDTSARVNVLGGTEAIGALKVLPTPPVGPRGVTGRDMTAPIPKAGEAPSAVAPTAPPAAPPAAGPAAPSAAGPAVPPVAPPSAAPSAPPVTPAIAPPPGSMGMGRAVDPGFSLPYPAPIAGVPQASTPSMQADLSAGQLYRQNLAKGQSAVPLARRNVEAVMEGIKELEKDRRFTTGPLSKREQYIREFFGDERFKQLSKDIANVEIAVISASGQSLSTDAGKSLVAKANGDETYAPSILISVARRQVGDLTRLDMESQAAQKFAQQYGDANLPAFRQAWAANSDQRIFEALAINKNERDPKRRQEALDKLLPSGKEELNEFLTKYENIQRLTQTGRLK